MQFGDNLPSGFRGDVWNCGQKMTDNGACLSYRLPPVPLAQLS